MSSQPECESNNNTKPMVEANPIIGIVAGEASGDTLGASLICALKKHFPRGRFVGIGGDKMIAEGFESLFPQDRLAVMGLIEPLKRLPELLGIRKYLKNYFIGNRPIVFIGIDSPDFNLDLERALKKKQILTTHYVSPSVWAWRQGRVKKIAQAIDLMLCLFPFETEIYKQHKIPVKCVGHALADEIDLEPDAYTARQLLLNQLVEKKAIAGADEHIDQPWLALLPGSRAGEVSRLAPTFFEAAKQCLQNHPTLFLLMPAANDDRRQQLEQLLQQYPDVPIHLFDRQSLQVMTASDLVLMASGTTTLEAMLLKKPMVIAYKLASFSYWLLSKLVRVESIGLPNLLAGRKVVPEYIQHEATPEALAGAVNSYLDDVEKRRQTKDLFLQLHQDLRRNAANTAAQSIKELVEKAGLMDTSLSINDSH